MELQSVVTGYTSTSDDEEETRISPQVPLTALTTQQNAFTRMMSARKNPLKSHEPRRTDAASRKGEVQIPTEGDGD